MSRLSVVVIGAGMYVCGRGTDGLGIVLPTLVQAAARGELQEIWVAATSSGSLAQMRDKLDQINARLGTSVRVHGVPAAGQNPLAYRTALAGIPRPACAIVVVPDHLHAPITEDVIDAGLPVLVVKPLTSTRAEAMRLIRQAQSKGVYGAVEFHKRWDEANLLLRQAIADGRLGELRHLSVEYGQRRVIQDAFASWRRHTNIFQYLGVHYADLISFVTGARPVRVLALGEPARFARGEPWKLDAIHALIEWKRGTAGFTASILTNWIEPPRASAMSDQRLCVLGTRGRYDSDQKHRGVQIVTDGGVEDLNPYFSQLYRDADGRMTIEGYGPRSIRQFLADAQALSDGTVRLPDLAQSRPTFRQALISTTIVEAVNASLSQGGVWVDVDSRESVDAPARRGPARARRISVRTR